MLELIQQGGWVMWPLLALSFIAIVFIIERLLFFWDLSRSRAPKQLNRVLALSEEGELKKAEKLAHLYQKDFIIRTLLSGLEHRATSLTQALETQALIESRKMKRYLSVFD